MSEVISDHPDSPVTETPVYAFLTPAAADLYRDFGATEVDAINVAELAVRLGVAPPEEDVAVIVRGTSRYDGDDPVLHRERDPSYDRASDYSIYYSGNHLSQEQPQPIRRGLLAIRFNTVLEGSLSGKVEGGMRAFTNTIAYQLQRPQRQQHRREALTLGLGSALIMVAAVGIGAYISKQGGDPEVAGDFMLSGVVAGTVGAIGTVATSIVRSARRAAKRRQFEYMPLLRLTKPGYEHMRVNPPSPRTTVRR